MAPTAGRWVALLWSGFDRNPFALTLVGTPVTAPDKEGAGELDLAHRALVGLTARTYPEGGPGSRCESHQRAVMPTSLRADVCGFYSADWAMVSW